MKLVITIVVFASAVYAAYALCNTCSAITNLACVANDQFQFCENGIPIAPSIQCPNGTVCTGMPQFCSPAETVEPSCGRCNICSSLNSFACIDYNMYALCVGSVVINSVNFTCIGTNVCNIDVANLCVDPTMTGIGGTCPRMTPTTTTPSPLVQPNAYCRNVATAGRYEITTDPYCKNYVNCALVNSTWTGNIYECPGITYFNATSGLCGVEVPTRCA